jgi:hypothetical protein
MSRVNPNLACHCLAIKSGCVPVAKKKRRMGPESIEAVEKQVKELLDARFIREIHYA